MQEIADFFELPNRDSAEMQVSSRCIRIRLSLDRTLRQVPRNCRILTQQVELETAVSDDSITLHKLQVGL